MYLKITGTVVAMNATYPKENAFDVLLNVQKVEGSPKAKQALLKETVVFEGVHSDAPFFVGDEISFLYRDELGPRRFDVEKASKYKMFVEVLSSLERSEADN